MSARLTLAIALLGSLTANAQQFDHTFYRLPAPSGFVVTADLGGLVVGLPETLELVYYNTLTEQEVKRVELDFKPGAMCLQDRTLYVAAQGTSLVYALRLGNGKVLNEFEVADDAIANLACHPTSGLIYASTGRLGVHSIDPATGKVTKTQAKGNFLAVSPDGDTVYTGFQPNSDDGDYVVKEGADGRIRVIWDDWGARAQLLKYAVAGRNLKVQAVQNNAAVNAYKMHLSPDGKRLLITSGGGWRPPAEGGTGGGYFTPAFSTTNLQSMVGRAPHGENIAFHPVLNLGATSHGGREVQVFNRKSFQARQNILVAAGADARPFLLTFGGKGTTIILWNGDNPQNPPEGLHFLPLDLSDAERAELSKKYGPLPKPAVVAAAPAEEPANPEPQSAAPARPTGRDVANIDPPQPKRTSRPRRRPATEGVRTGPLRTPPVSRPIGPIEATAGFNDAKGINADNKRQSPYPLLVAGVPGGLGEPGWAQPWIVGFDKPENLSFVKDVVQEGDGAAFLIGTAHMKRPLAAPINEFVEVELHVRVPLGGHCYVYIAEADGATGPMLGVVDGKFQAIDGTGQEFGNHTWREIVTDWDPERWYHIVVNIDVRRHEYDVYVDDQKFDHKPLHFRHDVNAIGQIGLLVEKAAGAYFDNIRVTPLTKSPLAE